MPADPFVTKGARVRARWFHAAPLGTYSLAGAQLKTTGRWIEVEGVVRHVRGDHPTAPMEVWLFVEADGDDLPRLRPPGCICADEHVPVKPEHVLEVIDAR
jgi:hypothetical protein